MKQFVHIIIIILFSICIFTGCSENQPPNDIEDTATTIINENVIIDLKDYFNEVKGCAVIYENSKKEYQIYNQELAETRSSPCSTFKIISTLIGLETKVLESENTVFAWNGTKYPVNEWNHDLTLKQAFQSSCVWYFRNVIDKAGKENTDRLLTELSYGNRDTSQWDGSYAGNNFSELNGFWLESSLEISPKEQVDVLIKIFEGKTTLDQSYIDILKDIMVIDNSNNIAKVYGKTGTGHNDKAWFVGIAETKSSTYCFAIRLDDPSNKAVSGQKAKEIALNLINNYLP